MRDVTKTLGDPRQKALTELIVRAREAAGLTQMDVARRLGQYQSFVARLESGQRRVDVIEFIEISEILGFDPAVAIKDIKDNRN